VQDHPIQHVDASWFRDLVQLSVQLSQQLNRLDEHIRRAIADAYARGVREAAERRTGVDPEVPDHG
jgi:hypothetical protein